MGHLAGWRAAAGPGPALAKGRVEVPADMGGSALQDRLPAHLRRRSTFLTMAAGVVYGLQVGCTRAQILEVH